MDLNMAAIDAAIATITPALPLASVPPEHDDAIWLVRERVGPTDSGEEQDRAAAYVAVVNAAPALVAEVRRLQKIERAARWFAVAAMDTNAPIEVGPQTVADLLEAFGFAPHAPPP